MTKSLLAADIKPGVTQLKIGSVIYTVTAKVVDGTTDETRIWELTGVVQVAQRSYRGMRWSKPETVTTQVTEAYIILRLRKMKQREPGVTVISVQVAPGRLPAQLVPVKIKDLDQGTFVSTILARRSRQCEAVGARA